MTVPLLPPVQRGDLLMLRDEDYLFGQGDVWLRVLVVYEVRWVWDESWIFLRGLELRADGRGRHQRDVLVRSEAMRTRRRRGL